MKGRGRAIGKQTHGLDWLGRILAGNKEGLDWPVLVQELLHLHLLLLLLLLLPRCWYSDTKTAPGCDGWGLMGSDKAGVAQGNEEGKRGAKVR